MYLEGGESVVVVLVEREVQLRKRHPSEETLEETSKTSDKMTPAVWMAVTPLYQPVSGSWVNPDSSEEER